MSKSIKESTYDAFIAKFSSQGNLLWATYYGGSGNEEENRLTIDFSGNVYIMGGTTSKSGIATSGAYKTSFGGAYLAKFSSQGNLLWGTYYGGPTDDGEVIATDKSGNVYLDGITESTSGIATSGAYQVSFGGDADEYLAKFDSLGSLMWATYFGGNGFENPGGICIDIDNNVYITGETESPSGIATSNAYQTSYGGNGDAYFAKFSPSGNLLFSSYYGGNDYDGAGGVASDSIGNIYLTGTTYSMSNISTSGAYQTMANEKEGDAFLSKFSIVTPSNEVGVSSIVSPKGAFCANSIPIKVQLKNYGPDTLKEVKILCSINDTIRLNARWDGNLSSGNSASVYIGNYIFKPGIAKIKVWTEPIGFTDTVPGNDTATVTDTIKALPDAFFEYKVSGDTVKFAPANGTYTVYSWAFGDGSVDSTPNPQHLYSKNGIYPVSLTVQATNGCTATYTTTDTINYTYILGAGENNTLFDIYPNPASHIFTISLHTKAENAEIALYNTLGQKLAVFDVKGKQSFTISPAEYSLRSGVYFLSLHTDNKVYTRKIIIN